MDIFKLKKAEERVWSLEDCDSSTVIETEYLIHSQYSSKEEIQSVLSRIDFRYHKNFIIFGIRNIELLTEIYKRKTAFSTMIIIEIIDEQNDQIYLQCNKTELTVLLDTKTVNIVIGNKNEVVNQLDTVLNEPMKLYNLRNLEILSMPYVKSLYPKEIEDVKTTIFERLHAFVASFGNSTEDILWGTDNYINNWKHVFRGTDYSKFENMYVDKPVIIVGAGPSLEKNIDKLKCIKGNALIMCVDAALDTLINAGIIPDIVASMERTEVTTKFYKRENMPQSIVYVGPNVIPGSILDRFSRIIFTGRNGDALFRDFNEQIGFSNMEIGANVAGILIAFAQYLGCNPIIFVGLDLAYTGGKTHISLVMDNLSEEEMNNSYKNKLYATYVKGQNGEMLETFEFFRHTKVWIEMQISQNKNRKYINSTEGGANIEGAENIKLANVISKYCLGEKLVPIKDKYDEVLLKYETDKVGTTEKAIQYFFNLEKYYNDIGKLSKSIYNRLNKYNESINIVQDMEKQRAKIEIKSAENPAGRFIIQSTIISFNRDIHSFPMVLDKEHERKMIERSKDFYITISKMSKKINETLKIYKEILNSHLIIFKNEENTTDGAK